MPQPTVNTRRRKGEVCFPSRTELTRNPLFTPRLTLEPVDARTSRKLYRAIEHARESLLPWLPWVPFTDTPEASHRYAEASEADWRAGTALRFTLRRRDEPDFVGVITLESCSKLHRSCDLGYWLTPALTGQGYMTEAARRILTFAFDEVGFHRIRCAAATENVRSQRVIERLGFQTEGLARDAERVAGRWVSHQVYSLLKSDAKKRKLSQEG